MEIIRKAFCFIYPVFLILSGVLTMFAIGSTTSWLWNCTAVTLWLCLVSREGVRIIPEHFSC